MAVESGSDYRDSADTLRAEEHFERSAQRFTLAAYEYLGASEYPDGQGMSSATNLGDALYCLQSAAVDFRRAGCSDRGRNRCRQGILVAEDYREHVSQFSAIDGVLTECIADFQVLAGIGDSTATYDAAGSYYADADEPDRWQSEPIFQSTIHFLIELALVIDDPIGETEQIDTMRSFQNRLALKRERLPRILAELD